MNRRQFFTGVLVGTAFVTAKGLLPSLTKRAWASEPSTSSGQVPALPYSEDSLEPHISAKTISLHYGKHHQGYATKLSGLIQGKPYSTMSLEEIIKETAGKADKTAIFNNAAQVWNHTFYWNSMKPKGGGQPKEKLLKQIEKDFESFAKFKEAFAQAAAGQFGSGWAWLIKDGEKLAITATGNADTPIAHGKKPLLTIDVWEHAYYLDYQNRRPDYITAFLEHLVNWDFAETNLA